MPNPVYPTLPPEPPPPLSEPDLALSTLQQFLQETNGLVDNIAYYWDQVLFKKDYREKVRSAWRELKSEVVEAMKSFLPGAINQYNDQLQRVGLSGKQLDLKLTALRNKWTEFANNGSLGLLQEVLEVIGSIIDSLAKVFPALEALKELVTTINWLVEQTIKQGSGGKIGYT